MNFFGTAAQIAGAFLVTVTAFGGEAAAAQDPIRLICEFKSPIGQEANQRYLLVANQRYLFEIGLDSKSMRSTQFIDGVAGNVTTYEISADNDHSITGGRKDGLGRLIEGVTVNRITSEAQFHWLVYGADRDKLWNSESKRVGGFKSDPVTKNSDGLQCRSAARQF
jgi:hypothetical protein